MLPGIFVTKFASFLLGYVKSERFDNDDLTLKGRL